MSESTRPLPAGPRTSGFHSHTHRRVHFGAKLADTHARLCTREHIQHAIAEQDLEQEPRNANYSVLYDRCTQIKKRIKKKKRGGKRERREGSRQGEKGGNRRS